MVATATSFFPQNISEYFYYDLCFFHWYKYGS
jgi:hypothetical protein